MNIQEQIADILRKTADEKAKRDEEITCKRPSPGPLYWNWRCLNCSEPLDAHPPWYYRLVWRFTKSEADNG